MTPTINLQSYAQLLALYQPKVIETEEENDRAIALAEELEHKPNRTLEEEAILELLVTLIEKGETIEQAISGLQEATKLYLEEFPLSKSSPRYITTMNVSYA